MGKSNSAHSVGPLGVKLCPFLAVPGIGVINDSSSQDSGGQISSMQSVYGKWLQATMRQHTGGTNWVMCPCNRVPVNSFPPKVLQRCSKHHFPNHRYRQGGKFSWVQKGISPFFAFYKAETGKHSLSSFSPSPVIDQLWGILLQ